MKYRSTEWADKNISRIQLFSGRIIDNTSDGLNLPGKRIKLILNNYGMKCMEDGWPVDGVYNVYVKIVGEKHLAIAYYRL